MVLLHNNKLTVDYVKDGSQIKEKLEHQFDNSKDAVKAFNYLNNFPVVQTNGLSVMVMTETILGNLGSVIAGYPTDLNEESMGMDDLIEGTVSNE